MMKMIMRMIMTLSLSFFILPTVALAEEMAVPRALVKNATEEMLQALKDNKDDLKTNPNNIYSLVEEILISNFDFEKMSKLALGKNWRKASASQRTEFTEEFRLLLVRTYSTAMLGYSGDEIRMLPFKDDVSKKKVNVKTEVLQPAGPSVPMSFSMFMNKAADWKVYDVKIDGISLVTTYRTSFSSQIRKEGMDDLIASLANKNAKVKQ